MNRYTNIFFVLIVAFELVIVFELIIRYNWNLNFNNDFAFLENNFTYPKYSSDFIFVNTSSNLLFELRPNFSQKSDGFFVRLPSVTTININSAGFRDYEYPLEKSKNSYRIIVLGDSFTFGAGVELEETYSKILEHKLNSLNNSINYEVLNFGVPGYNTFQEVEQLRIKGLKYKPDLVIIGYDFYDDLFDYKEMFNLQLQIANEKLNEPFTTKKQVEITYEAGKIMQNIVNNKSFNEKFKILESSFGMLWNMTYDENVTVIIVPVTVTIANDHKVALQEFSKDSWFIMNSTEFFVDYQQEDLVLDIRYDPHINSLGHKILGEKIFKYLTSNNIIPQ